MHRIEYLIKKLHTQPTSEDGRVSVWHSVDKLILLLSCTVVVVPLPRGHVVQLDLLAGGQEGVPVEGNTSDVAVLSWGLHNDVHLGRISDEIQA